MTSSKSGHDDDDDDDDDDAALKASIPLRSVALHSIYNTQQSDADLLVFFLLLLFREQLVE